MKSIAQGMLNEDFRSQLADFGLQLDQVTGLPNHVSFRAEARRMLDRALRDRKEIALLWIDVLNVRQEYSMEGDAGADRLLSAVADSLRPWVNPGELICRFADHCFLLALKRDERIHSRLKSIFEAGSHSHLRGTEGKPELAAGVAFFPEHATSTGELVRFASMAAVLAARTRSRSTILFHPRMNTALLLERNLEKDLRTALKENQLTLAYQPQIDLTTGQIVGAEGVTRWNHPIRGSVSPAEFIPVAERSDLIDEIFRNSLRTLLADAAEWRRAGVVLPSLAVNASAANIRHEGFLGMVKREMAANPPGGTRLDIEVTESLMLDDESLFVERLRALRALGVSVSMDDFGTRYTSFHALKGLPLNTMKIDQGFVHGVARSAQSQSLCRTIVTMARHLKLGTVAEGIETMDELRVMKKIGCQAGQGYLFQRPVPADRFLQFLAEWPERKREGEFKDIFADWEADLEEEADPVFGVA